MRTIGLLGGMSWESSALYYRLLNEAVRDQLGGLHSARCVLLSVDFAGIERLQEAGDWDARRRAAGRRRPVAAGGRRRDRPALHEHDAHRRRRVTAALDVPLLHIGDSHRRGRHAPPGSTAVGLLGTALHDGAAVPRRPAQRGRARGRSSPSRTTGTWCTGSSTRSCASASSARSPGRPTAGWSTGWSARGAEGVVLGCTEIELLIGPDDVDVPIFPTTALHVEAAVRAALGDDAPGRRLRSSR